MAFSRRAAAVLLIFFIARAAPHAQAVQRSLYVSVLNDAGAPVPDLGPSDFIVREDGLAREVLRVVPATDPMQIAVLVDNSQAARDDIADLRKALHAFVTAMTAGSAAGVKNEIAIIGLADRPTILADYTSDAARLRKGIDRVFSTPQSGTLLLQGIIDVCKGFKTREAARPVIVAITTEGPELSDRYYDLVLEALLASGAAFHAIVLGPPRGGTSDAERDRGIVLDRGTRETGGRRDNVLTSMSLTPKLTELAAELTHQYKVTYAHPQSLIPPEHVTVAAAKAGMTARGTLIKERQQRKP